MPPTEQATTSSTIACTLTLLSTLSPPSSSRAWQTAVHPRLPLLATANADKEVIIYSLTSFTQVGGSISGGHKRSIRTVAWKPNLTTESVLATGSFDASVGIWRRGDDAGAPGSSGAAREIDFTTGMKSAAGNDDDGNGDEREEDDEWRFALVLDGHDSEVKSVAWSAGGNLLATCSRDKSVWIWEEVGEDDYETIAVLQEHSADVKCVAWHPEEELLASGSYDDDVRLWREDVDDWDCVAVLRGHESTVWMVEFEGVKAILNFIGGEQGLGRERADWMERREMAGARLVSCSDDRTVRVWRRVPREKTAQNQMSIIRSRSIEEHWVEETQLPVAHTRAIHAVTWSRRTGRIVSAGGDGKIVVYEERWGDPTESDGKTETDITAQADQMDGSATNEEKERQRRLDALTEWHIVAEFESAHGVYEINHVAWARRADKGKSHEDEEVVVSTGDDGAVRVWTIS